MSVRGIIRMGILVNFVVFKLQCIATKKFSRLSVTRTLFNSLLLSRL